MGTVMLAMAALGLLGLAGFFSAAEYAFLFANKFQLALRERDSRRTGRLLAYFSARPNRLLATVQVGYYSAVAGAVTIWILKFSPLVLAMGVPPGLAHGAVMVLVAALVVLALADYLPRALVARRPLDAFVAMVPLLYGISRVLLPLAGGLTGLSALVINGILRVPRAELAETFTKQDLHRYLGAHTESQPNPTGPSEDEAEMFRNALDFNETEIKEFMVPRTEVVALDVADGLDALHARFLETELSRILIYEDSLDHLLGYVHASDLYSRPAGIRAILHPLIAVPLTMTADLLLREFTQQRKSVAVVVDEYGGTAGLVTIEDLVEVVFGDIEDEYDEDEYAESEHEWVMEPLGPNQWRIGARVPVEDANETLDLMLPLDDDAYSTVGGLLMHTAERIPTPGEAVAVGPYRFTVERATRRRVETLHLERLGTEPEQEED